MSTDNKSAPGTPEARPEAAGAGPQKLGSLAFYPGASNGLRLFALWYFAFLMTAWNIVGHTILGFEQSWQQYLTAMGTALFVQFLLEWVDARANCRPLRFAGGVSNFLNFLPPAIIAGSACGMLLFANERCWPYAFASAFSIGSKVLLRVPMANGASQHAFNPSNLGIVVTIMAFPWIGIAPPYHFTNRIDIGDGTWNLIVPFLVMVTGIFLHGLVTGRLPLIAAWILGFIGQALVRSVVNGLPFMNLLIPMTGASFVIFTLYMIPDPATTPIEGWAQVVFGVSIAAVYGIFLQLHIVYGWFLALITVAAIRYVILWARHLMSDCCA